MRDVTASLTGMILRRVRRDERGAVAIIVAMLLGSGVLLGMSALVIDVARVYQERAELQNGADAAAIAVAKSCALGACDPNVAVSTADANASRLTGGTEGVSEVCGSDGLGTCPTPTGTLADCLAPPPAGINFVQVYTSTRLPDGSTLLPPVFADALLGNGGYQGSTVRACAQAEWGAPSAATTVAMTISACEWDQATQQGTLFAQEPPYPPDEYPAISMDQELTLNSSPGGGCPTEPSGADGPGTFGWVSHVRGNCTVSINGPFVQRTRSSTSISCGSLLQNAQQNQIPVLVPIYVSLQGGTYTLKGFATFVVTGFSLPDIEMFAPDWLDPANDCPVTQECLDGYFVQGVIPNTGSVSGVNLGASVIDLTG